MNLSYQIRVRLIFVYQKSLKRTFNTGFWVQYHLWIVVLVLWIIVLSKSWCELIVLKLSGIQKLLSCLFCVNYCTIYSLITLISYLSKRLFLCLQRYKKVYDFIWLLFLHFWCRLNNNHKNFYFMCVIYEWVTSIP